MNAILIKIFATALTLSQVTVRPDAIKTDFDATRDRAEVTQLLQDGCAHMMKVFDLEDINLDDLIETAMQDPGAVAGDVKAFKGLDFKDLYAAYKQYCKKEAAAFSPVDLGEVIAYYDKAVADLPDHRKLKGLVLPGSSLILDGTGQKFTEVYAADGRRIWVPLADIPDHVRKAFVAAEDKRFYEHKGIDERGVIRAFVANFAQPGRPQGGSTITQQVAKNLLVGDDVTYDRKMREMIVASRIERTLTKDEILELYLNDIYLGRSSWGIEMAARSYFGKSAKDLTLAEGAELAALTRGPNYYNPERHPDRMHDRFLYVLGRMREDGYITADQERQAQGELPHLVPFVSPRAPDGFSFVDQVARDAKTLAGVGDLTQGSYTVRSTLVPKLQTDTEAALQEGLARYERDTGRFKFEGPEANLAEAVRKIEAAPDGDTAPDQPAWRRALAQARLPLYDVHWSPAVVLDAKAGKSAKTAKAKSAGTLQVGLADGRILPLKTWTAAIRRQLKPFDVVLVQVTESKRGASADLRIRPSVQGAALVLDNRTGRILAMAGGFSYPLSQLNRATQTARQPGSALKPLTYLAALTRGLQPNTLVWDAPLTLPPVGGGKGDAWSPRNYDGMSGALVTIRRALETSKNLATARLLSGGISPDPERSLDIVCALAKEAKLYETCERYYPFILGAEPVRLVDLAAFYAAIANEGARPVPHVIESVAKAGHILYRAPETSEPLEAVDHVALYQMKTFLQGVLQRGTAAKLHDLAPYAGGKTGTTDGSNDAWFVGFTNDVTIAVWVGYDNAGRTRRTLGGKATGARVAAPIFRSILEAAWRDGTPKTALRGPSPEAERLIVAEPIDLQSGDRLPAGTRGAFIEHFRAGSVGSLPLDTQFSLVPRGDLYASSRGEYGSRGEPDAADPGYGDPYGGRYGAPPTDDPGWRYGPEERDPYSRPYARPPYGSDEDYFRRPRRVDPDYFWGRIY